TSVAEGPVSPARGAPASRDTFSGAPERLLRRSHHQQFRFRNESQIAAPDVVEGLRVLPGAVGHSLFLQKPKLRLHVRLELLVVGHGIDAIEKGDGGLTVSLAGEDPGGSERLPLYVLVVYELGGTREHLRSRKA